MEKCPIYCEVENCVHHTKGLLAAKLMDEIKRQLLVEHGDEMQEDLASHELCTDAEHNCFMHHKDSNYMQDFAYSEVIACLVDAYNTVKFGKPSHCWTVN